jgi:hypothetical protein
VAVVVLVLAGCGGGSNTTSTREKAAAARWVGGLRHWSSEMTLAIDGISVLFSRPVDVRGIQAGDPRIGRQLAAYERTLAGCSVRVKRLGTPPSSLVLAEHEALHACISLERAAVLLRTGVRSFQRGLGPDVLNATAEPLSAGQDGIRRARLDLVQG